LSGLLADDGERVELVRGQIIDLAFDVPRLEAGYERNFILVTEGHYERDAVERLADETPSFSVVSASAPFPNPSRAGTKVRFDLPQSGGHVSVRIYNMVGRLVRHLGDSDLPAGLNEVEWDGCDATGDRVAAGVYFYRIEVDGAQQLRKVVVLK
jgi:hypothetical protein